MTENPIVVMPNLIQSVPKEVNNDTTKIQPQEAKMIGVAIAVLSVITVAVLGGIYVFIGSNNTNSINSETNKQKLELLGNDQVLSETKKNSNQTLESFGPQDVLGIRKTAPTATPSATITTAPVVTPFTPASPTNPPPANPTAAPQPTSTPIPPTPVSTFTPIPSPTATLTPTLTLTPTPTQTSTTTSAMIE